MEIKFLVRAIGILMLLFTIVGCTGIVGTFDYTGNPVYDSESGRFPDNERNRDIFVETYEKRIQSEASGGYLAPAYDTWDEQWDYVFQQLRDGSQENPEYYISYIKRRRAELGLPNN
jgi:hypothetical protein